MRAENIEKVVEYLCKAAAKEFEFEFSLYNNLAFTFCNVRCVFTLQTDESRIKSLRVKRQHLLKSLMKQFEKCVYIECEGVVLRGKEAQIAWDSAREYVLR